MLETPLFGRFSNEDRMLVFSAPTEYHVLVRVCVIGGALSTIYGVMGFFGMTLPPVGSFWWACTSLAVCLAGVFAAYSLVMIRLDAKTGMYRRREGGGAFGTTTVGTLSDLDALVLIAEPNARMMNGGVTYHLVLHWKGGKEPPMVVQQDTRAITPGQPLNLMSQQLRDRGAKYAKAIKVPFYDNAHFASPNPVRLF